MIEQSKISLISNKTHQSGGRRIPEAVIERDYCLSWFLFGLASSPLKPSMAFKGGTALRRCYFKNYRFSEDLDFTLVNQIAIEDILSEFKKIFLYIEEESGITFAHRKCEPSTENTHTFYITYIGPLPGREKDVKVDVTHQEKVVYPLEERPILKTYEEYSDFLADPQIKVYSLEEVAIEKICALFSPARNEPRDLYDIHYLITDQGIQISELMSGITDKMSFKGYKLDERKDEFLKKEGRLKKLWKNRLDAQMTSLPEFETVFREVKRNLRQAGLGVKK